LIIFDDINIRIVKNDNGRLFVWRIVDFDVVDGLIDNGFALYELFDDGSESLVFEEPVAEGTYGIEVGALPDNFKELAYG